MSLTQHRQPLFTCNHADEAYSEIERLHALFKSTFKRAMNCDLFFSDQGMGRDRVFGITAYFDDTHVDDVSWCMGAVKQ